MGMAWLFASPSVAPKFGCHDDPWLPPPAIRAVKVQNDPIRCLSTCLFVCLLINRDRSRTVQLADASSHPNGMITPLTIVLQGRSVDLS